MFLWLEAIRLHQPFRTPQDYMAWPGRLYPEFPAARNWLLHLRDRLRRGRPPRGWFDYPRAPLQRALVLLLQPAAPLRVAPLLGLGPDASPEEILAAYRHWWRFYN